MTNIPIREVGTLGALPDLNPFSSPPNAVTSARNVLFVEGSATRSNVFKRLRVPQTFSSRVVNLSTTTPHGAASVPLMVCADGSIKELYNGSQIDVSGPDPLGVVTQRPTFSRLASVDFINSGSAVPLYKAEGDLTFSKIPNWDATTVCRTFRSFKDFALALNVTKGVKNYPYMVKWSDAAQVGAPPQNWDTASDVSLAGELVINDAIGEIVDGAALGDAFMIYGTEETHRLEYIDQPFIFAPSKVFSDVGVISKDCVATVGSKHYVFTRTDIIVHNGIERTSLTESRVRRRIFGNLSVENRQRCFVYHDRSAELIYFCYPSKSEECEISVDDTLGCNEAAVYDVRKDTWTFVDLAGVVAITDTTVPDVITWDSLENWNDETATWTSRQGDPTEMPLCACVKLTNDSAKLLFLDAMSGGYLSNPISDDTPDKAWVEFSHKDFDDYGIPLASQKTIRTIYPQITVRDAEDFVQIKVGSSQTPVGDIRFDTSTNFFPWTDLKRDCRKAGRYLTIRFTFPNGVWASLSGYDLDILALSKR